MLHTIKSALAYAKIELLRSMRDPMTTLVLFGIPVVLVLIFGSLVSNGSDLSVRVAVVNNSQTQFADNFAKALSKVKPFEQPKEQLTLQEARDKMNDDSLDGIIELPAGFGTEKDGVASGAVKLYYDRTDSQTGDIVAGIMRGVVDEANKSLVTTPTPVTIERTPINVNEGTAFDNIFSMFTGMAIMMVGVFAVASVFPTAKKLGVLRRLHATPLKAREIILGTTMCYTVIGLIGVGLLTAIALMLFDLNMHGDWLTFSAFVLFSLIVMLGFGLAIGGIAKNSTQSDVWGQVVFLASMAVSGIWVPRALMPDWMQAITDYAPLTPIIHGISAIVSEGAALAALGQELIILAVWGVIVYVIGIRMFRWE